MQLRGGVPSPDNFHNLRTNCAIPMKHFPSKKLLFTNILILKCLPHMTGNGLFLQQSKFTDQDI